MTDAPLRVALVSPRYAPYAGGVERHVQTIANGLVRRGIAVDVIATDPSHQLPAEDEIDGVHVHRFPTVAHDAVFFVAPRLGLWLTQHAQRYSLIHAHSYHTPLSFQAALASRWAGVPFVVTPHYHGTGHSKLRSAMHVPYRVIGRWMIRSAQQVLCVSESEQQLIRAHFGQDVPTSIVHNGVEVDGLLATPPAYYREGRKLVLTVGRLEGYKQIDQLIRAMQFLPPHFQLVVVGDGTGRVAIDDLARRVNPERITITGRVSDAELLRWYRTADVFVSLSQHEAFGLTLLEGAVAGAPVVVSDIAAHREVGGYLPQDRLSFVPTTITPEQIARTIEAAATKQRTTSIEGWPLPTWDQAIAQTLDRYRAVLGQTGRGLEQELAS